ncbi:MAG: glycine cleavage system aminomethyltransferase GcvT [Gemmatimonadetes bacterium]|nr:MAG: glycine cleavage system aminomethyltransferase GcvT [Gemmatimonadota bacterium]
MSIRTPFYDKHIAAGARMVDFAGYEMPIQYQGIIAEHVTVRQSVGMFDLSHMGEFWVSGADALPFLMKMMTNNASKLAPGQVMYSAMCYEDGGIVDDLLVYRDMAENRYLLVVNAANIQKDFDWLQRHLEGDVTLENKSAETGLLAIQGPQAEAVVAKMTDLNLADMRYYHFDYGKIAGYDALISRTGYTGEDGFELYLPPEACPAAWDAAVEAGAEFGIKPVGLGARDTLRLEMKMALYGNDIDHTTNPIEAGLGWICKTKNREFIGRDAIVRMKTEKPARKLICFEMQDKNIPRPHYKIFAGDQEVGTVTSGTKSPSLKIGIGLGYVQREFTQEGTELQIEIRQKKAPAKVVKPPFYKNGTVKIGK